MEHSDLAEVIIVHITAGFGAQPVAADPATVPVGGAARR